MPIRFHCGGCQYLLQVPDDAAGKKARCPRCQAIADVPWTSQTEGDASATGAGGGTSPSPAGDEYRLAPPEEKPPETSAWPPQKPLGPLPTKPAFSDNPYQSPSYTYDQPKFGANPYGAGDKGPLHPSRIVLDDVFRFSWQIFQQNMGILVGVGALILGVNFAFSMLGNVVMAAFEGEEFAPLIVHGINLATWPIITFLEIGQAIVYLKVARGQRVEFSEMFSGGKYLLRSLGGDFLWNLMLVLGICALIVPGIFLALMLWPYYLLIIDRDQGVFESFSTAQQLTEGNKGTMFVVYLANIGIMLLGCLALGVGVIFAYPLVTMMIIVSYLMMTGQFYKRA